MAALRLPPKYTVYEKINKERCQIEIESMVTKYRWEMMEDKEKDNNMVRTDNGNVGIDLDLNGEESTNKQNETESIEERAYHYYIDSKKFDF